MSDRNLKHFVQKAYRQSQRDSQSSFRSFLSIKSNDEKIIEHSQCFMIISKIKEQSYSHKETIDDFLHKQGQSISEANKTELVQQLMKLNPKLKTIQILKYIQDYLSFYGFYKKYLEHLHEKERFEIIQKSKLLQTVPYQYYTCDEKTEYVVKHGTIYLFSAHSEEITYPNIELLEFKDFCRSFDSAIQDISISMSFKESINKKIHKELRDKLQIMYNINRNLLNKTELHIIYFLVRHTIYYLREICLTSQTITCIKGDYFFSDEESRALQIPIMYEQESLLYKVEMLQPLYDHHIFSSVSKRLKQIIFSNMEIINMKYDQTIIHENEKSDYLYVIKSGSVRLLKLNDKLMILIQELTDLGYFGEEQQAKMKNNFTVVCTHAGQLYKIHKKAFNMQNCKYIQQILQQSLKQKLERYKEKLDYLNNNKRIKEPKLENAITAYKNQIDQHNIQTYIKRPLSTNTTVKDLSHFALHVNKGSKFGHKQINKLNISIWKQKYEKYLGQPVQDSYHFTKEKAFLDFKESRQQSFTHFLEKSISIKPKKKFLQKKEDTYLMQSNSSISRQHKSNILTDKLDNTQIMQNPETRAQFFMKNLATHLKRKSALLQSSNQNKNIKSYLIEQRKRLQNTRPHSQVI